MSKLFPRKKGLSTYLMPFNIQHVIIQFNNKPVNSSVYLKGIFVRPATF